MISLFVTSAVRNYTKVEIPRYCIIGCSMSAAAAGGGSSNAAGSANATSSAVIAASRAAGGATPSPARETATLISENGSFFSIVKFLSSIQFSPSS